MICSPSKLRSWQNRPAALVSIQINVEHNQLDVGATDVAQVQSALDARFGPQAPFNVYLEADEPALTAGVEGRPTGRVKATESISISDVEWCSAGFGAWDRNENQSDGSPLYRHFILTAGHCFPLGTRVYQWVFPKVLMKNGIAHSAMFAGPQCLKDRRVTGRMPWQSV